MNAKQNFAAQPIQDIMEQKPFVKIAPAITGLRFLI